MNIARFPSGVATPESTTCCLCTKPITIQEASLGPTSEAKTPRFMCGTHLAEGRQLIAALVNYYNTVTPSFVLDEGRQ